MSNSKSDLSLSSNRSPSSPTIPPALPISPRPRTSSNSEHNDPPIFSPIASPILRTREPQIQTHQNPSQPTHPMITRNKVGIFKPKVYFCDR